MRQKVAFVVKVSLSLLLSLMTEFSPVRITRFASTVLITDYPRLVLIPRLSRMQRDAMSSPHRHHHCTAGAAKAIWAARSSSREDHILQWLAADEAVDVVCHLAPAPRHHPSGPTRAMWGHQDVRQLVE